MTAKEFLEWETYASIEPFMHPVVQRKEDIRTAAIRETIFNMAVATRHRRAIKDFILEWELKDEKKRATVPRQSPQEVLAILTALAMGQAAIVREGGDR